MVLRHVEGGVLLKFRTKLCHWGLYVSQAGLPSASS